MLYQIDGEEYINGIRGFLKIYYKEELKNGSLKKTIKVYVTCLIVLLALCLITPGLKQLYFIVIGLLFIVTCLVVGVILLTLLVVKRKKYNNNIIEVDQLFEDNIYIKVYKSNGNIEKTQYAYKDIKKVVEADKYFYVFIGGNVVFPLLKNEREKFIEFMLSKNVLVRERKK